MKKFGLILVLAFIVIQCQGQNATDATALDILNDPKVNSGAVLAKVGGLELKEGFLTALSTAIPNMKDKIENPMARKKLIESIIEQELLYQEGLKRGVLNDPAVNMKILINQRSVIASALMEDELNKKMLGEYEKRKDSDFTKVEIAQILVSYLSAEDKKNKVEVTDAKKKAALKLAQDIVKKVKAGESFEDLAKKHSADKRTADRGGAAGHVAKQDKRYEKMGLKAVTEKAFNLKKDQLSDPIETETGYYVIKVTSAPEVTSFEDAKRVLSFDLQAQVKEEILSELKKQNPIEFVGAINEEANKAQTPTITSQSITQPEKPAAKKIEITPAPEEQKGKSH